MISASWSSNGTNRINNGLQSTYSRIKWWLISTCFERLCKTGLVVNYVALTLSHQSKGVDDKEIPISNNIDWSQISSTVTLDIPLFSDSALDREIAFCLEDKQDIKLIITEKTQNPLVLHLSTQQLAQLAYV